MFVTRTRHIFSFLLFLSAPFVSAQCSGPSQAPFYSCVRSIVNGVGDFSYATDPTLSAPNWGGPTGAGNIRYDSLYNNIEMFRCTDSLTNPSASHPNFEVGLGGDGSRVSWNTTDDLLNVVEQGNTFMMSVDVSHDTCKPICANGAIGGCTTANPLATFGGGYFSKVDPHVYYSWSWDGAFSPRIYKVTLAAGSAPSATLLVDFSPALYKSTQPNWAANSNVTVGQVVEPVTNNGSTTGGHYPLFQAITNGTTGSTNPNFASAVFPYRANTHVVLPQPDYLGGTIQPYTVINPSFDNPDNNLYITYSGGTTSGYEPLWYVWCRAVGSNCIDGSVTWVNLGLTSIIKDGTVKWVKVSLTQNETSQDPVGVENGDDSFAKGLSYNGIQNTGIWALLYKASTKTIYQYNTYTQVETDFVCTNSGSHICPSAHATWTPSVAGIGGAGVSMTIHNIDLSQDGKTLNIGDGNCQYVDGSACLAGGQNLIWTSGSATTVTPTVDNHGHGVIGNTHIMNDSESSTLTSGGEYEAGRTFTNVNSPYPMVQFSPCSAGSAGSGSPPPCYPQTNAHWSWVYNTGSDQEPIIGTGYDLGVFPATSIFQNEIIGFSACGLTGEPVCPSGYQSNAQYRFGRTFAYQTDYNNFNSWAVIGALSQTGNYYALTSTGFCTMGDTSGGNSPRCGWVWSPSVSYTCGALGTATEIVPIYYSNPGSYAYHATTSSSCTQGSTEPAWCQTAGCTVADNGITWVNDGVTNGRTDVLIYKIGAVN